MPVFRFPHQEVQILHEVVETLHVRAHTLASSMAAVVDCIDRIVSLDQRLDDMRVTAHMLANAMHEGHRCLGSGVRDKRGVHQLQ